LHRNFFCVIFSGRHFPVGFGHAGTDLDGAEAGGWKTSNNFN